jgi:hypothetical protein
MLAPHLSTFLPWQSDLGHPAGDVLATIVSEFSPKSGLWRGSLHVQLACGGPRAVAEILG